LAASTSVALLNSFDALHYTATATPQNTPTPQDVSLAMYRAGLDPRSLAAACVSSGSVATVVSDFRNQLTNSLAGLTSADANLATARQQVEALERRIQSGQGSTEDVTALAAARTSLALATSAQQSGLNDLFNAG